VANWDLSEKIGLRPLLITRKGQTGSTCARRYSGFTFFIFIPIARGFSIAGGLAFFLALGIDALTDPWVGKHFRSRAFQVRTTTAVFPRLESDGGLYYLLLSPPPLGAGLFIWFLISTS